MPKVARTPETILVYVGCDLIGDGLMKLPFLRALRNAYPNARITWLAGKGKTVYGGKLGPLTKGLLDEVIEDAGIGEGWVELLSRPLPGRRFDLIFDTQRRLVTTLVLRRIRHRYFVSGCGAYLLSNLRPKGVFGFSYRKPQALVDQMLELLALAHGGRVDAPLDLSGKTELPQAVRGEAARLLPPGKRYVALAPGAGQRIKCWPLESYMALARRLADRNLIPLFLLGPEEQEWLEPLRTAVSGVRFPLAEPGTRLDLEPLLTIALAERCAACIANDSGSGHLFAASGAPLVVLYGPTPPEKFAPRVENLTTIKAPDFGSSNMAAIPVDAVDQAMRMACGD